MPYLWQFKRVAVPLAAALVCASLAAAVSGTVPSTYSPAAAAGQGIALASKGYCHQALPVLKKAIPHLADRQLQYHAAMASAQCGMSVNQMDAVVEALVLLNRNFPDDPKVLYMTTRYYSELANRTAHKLLQNAPSSPEAQELVAEALQAQGKWNEAEDAYRKILAKYPNQPGVHYELGRVILSKPLSPAVSAEAEKEFEAELKIDPTSPAAEFMLGEIAWRERKLSEAIEHFSQATKFDVGFAEAYLGLGIALNAAGKYSEAVTVLEKYVAMNSTDPAGHYQLAIAYSRTGNKLKANQQLALLRETAAKSKQQAATPENMSQPH